MKVFISWSGELSRLVAKALYDWLPDVVNAADPWMSSEDIEAGSVGLNDIARELQDTSFGIVCLTQENHRREWINYEGGALSKATGDLQARVATVLIDLPDVTNLRGPLTQFQWTRFDELTSIQKLVVTLDRHTPAPREPARVEAVVEGLWQPYKRAVDKAVNTAMEIAAAPPVEVRTADDKIDEILIIVRRLKTDLTNDPENFDPEMVENIIRGLITAMFGAETSEQALVRLDTHNAGLVMMYGTFETKKVLNTELRLQVLTGMDHLRLLTSEGLL